jgi:hypothetical protein
MSMFEKHHSPKYYAELWGMSVSRVRRMFRDELGVVLDGKPSRRLGKKLKRSYFTMTIPESVAARVYERMVQKRPPSGKPLQPVPLAAKPPSDSSLVSPEP